MTAACAAIWLAERPDDDWLAWPLGWFKPTEDRFDVLVDGRLESNMPWVAECFLEWFLSNGDVAPWAANLDPAGREKF
jgi:hypothetical protein